MQENILAGNYVKEGRGGGGGTLVTVCQNTACTSLFLGDPATNIKGRNGINLEIYQKHRRHGNEAASPRRKIRNVIFTRRNPAKMVRVRALRRKRASRVGLVWAVTPRPHLLHDGVVVARGVQLATAGPRAPGLLAQVAAAGKGEEGLDEGAGERDDVVAGGLAALVGRLGCGGHQVGRAAREVRLGQHQREGSLVAQHVLRKRGLQLRQPAHDLRVARLAGSVKLGPGAHKVQVQPLHQANLQGQGQPRRPASAKVRAGV